MTGLHESRNARLSDPLTPSSVCLHAVRLDKNNTPSGLRELINAFVNIRSAPLISIRPHVRAARFDSILCSMFLVFVDFAMKYFIDKIVTECVGHR